MADSFELDLSRAINHINLNVNTVVKKVLLDLGKEVNRRSPVGDQEYWRGKQISENVYEHAAWKEGYVGGHFRANWQYGYGVIPGGEIDGVQNNFMARLSSGIPEQNIDRIHYIVNNTPYAHRIEYGLSWHQAPKGVVGQSVANFNAYVRRAAQQVNP